MRGREIWLRFATWILLALEFALAADLVRTAVAPTWDDISKLAVIATIRTMLNYFLAKDIAEFDRALKEAGVKRHIETYPGAPHSFFDRTAADHKDACDDAWRRALGFIKTGDPASRA